MNLSSAAITLLFGLLIQLNASAQIIFGPVDNSANGHRYFLLEDSTWNFAQEQAIAIGGNLVTVNDADEHQWLIDTFADVDGTPRNLWIGLTDESNEGEFVWISGEESDFENWDDGEPSDSGNGEDYTHIIIVPVNMNLEIEKWNDAPNSINNDLLYSGIVEINVIRGDVNMDGEVDLLDVQPFVALITSGEFKLEADVNLDGVVDLLDVAAFVELLSS